MHKHKAVYEINNLKLDKYHVFLNEALFHNANGYIGVRSVFEEGYPEGYDSIRGQYINGFYDFSRTRQAERLYGLVEERQTMLNVADTQTVKITLDDEPFSMFSGTVLSSRRWVDMDKGVTGREVTWRSPRGKEVSIRVIRMASFIQLPLFTIDYNITPLNFSGDIMIESHHDGNVTNYGDPKDPRTAEETFRYLTPESCEIQYGSSYIKSTTSKAGLEVCSCVKNVMCFEGEKQFIISDNNAVCQITASAKKGEEIRLLKYTIFCDSIRYPDCRQQAVEEIKKAVKRPIEELYDMQADYLAEYWDNCDIGIEGDDELNTAMRYNLFQLIQSVGKDERSNIAPKGLSGEGYEGHYFWDAEMYIQPFFTVTNPSISRSLIAYRYTILEKAKENARRLGHKRGALYPWRTIMGRECSGYFPGGSAQYHINGAIAYSIISYYLATKDYGLIRDMGAEIIFETARLWIDTGNFAGGVFNICDVTGPDEYTCLVNNNYYTNALAQYHLRWAVKIFDMLKAAGDCKPLAQKLRLRKEELVTFEKAADSMALPYDEELGINPQDDSFLEKPRLDLSEIPKNKFPLLLHYHPLHLYRHQVCKQPDTVLAHFILEDAQPIETIRNSFHYYEKLTTFDSSLSTCVFSIMAARLGMEEKAFRYFGNSAKMDILDLHKNSHDGLHCANMGGNYMAIVYGFGGFRLKENGISFSPMLPAEWTGYHFRICYEDSRIVVHVNKEEARFTLEYGTPKEIAVYDQPYVLKDRLIVKRPAIRYPGDAQ